jgi:hypothetical protein
MAALSAAVPTPDDRSPGSDPRFFGFEPFVDEHVIAAFLQITPRHAIELARKGEIPSHPIGHKRKTWRFLISEVSAHFSTPSRKPNGGTMAAAVTGIRKKAA